MSIRRLAVGAGNETAFYRPYLNTGGPLDMVNGKFIPTPSGTYALSGGVGLTTAFIATANKFKSSLQNHSMINTMARFPDSQTYIYDPEMSALDKDRLANMSDLHMDDPDRRATHIEDIKDRIELHDLTTGPGDSLDCWFDYMKEIRDEKIKAHKDYTVESEVLNPETGKPYLMLLPTLIGIDSWTMAPVKLLNTKNEEFTADTEDNKQKKIFMDEGWKKTQLMNQLPGMCAKGGLYTFMTGHIGKKVSMDGKPLAKDMMFMGQDETVKAMGPKFYYLMASVFKILKTMELSSDADRKLSEYPSQIHKVSGHELMELRVQGTRLKNAPSGGQTDIVSSQTMGVRGGLSYYRYLRNQKYYGLGAPNKVKSPLLGDLNLGRTKIFDLSTEFKVKRALELTYQLHYIQSNWTVRDSAINYNISIEEFADLLSKSTIAADDILHSRGWWTYTDAVKSGKVDQNFMTLPDIINILTNNYKTKFVQVA